MERPPRNRVAKKLGLGLLLPCLGLLLPQAGAVTLEQDFAAPPDSARPWVYWYFMDGNLTRPGMAADLEAMKSAGIGSAIFLEVGIGVPRGPVPFMSPEWQDLLEHAVTEADQLGLQLALGAGPGWCGTGGPWVPVEHSMQDIVASATPVTGPMNFDSLLPRPQPRTPFFGIRSLTPELAKQWREFYRDVAVLAVPTPAGDARIADIDEKALYYRAPYSSQPGVKPFLPAPADFPVVPAAETIAASSIIDLTSRLGADGRLAWTVPAGNWTILRFGRTSTGQITRPAPLPGLGFESDKFDPAALDDHFDHFVGALLRAMGDPPHPGRGLTTVHFDSWEMSSQNWTPRMREEFRRRRGYDLLKFLPVMTGRVVDSVEVSERFLWDLRQTAQELVVENHAEHLRDISHRHGLALSLEPYDLNPTADLHLGGAADVPMGEFWSKGYDYPTDFSCIEAVSIAHTMGRPIVGGEAFTANPGEDWHQYPGSMKNQTDWALACGINRFVIHRYQAQPWNDRFPGMTMGPYGVHWERTQTWWSMVPAYHAYLTRCQEMLRRGRPVADILYLNPEGAPMVFRPPASATIGNPPDRRGYNFDGCDPAALIERATVRDGRIVFPDGMSYRVLVLPRFDTMTPPLLRKIESLVAAGATVIGTPPRRSPSLTDYPQCDADVQKLAAAVWDNPAFRSRVIRDPADAPPAGTKPELYPAYDQTARVLAAMDVPPDFAADGSLRYTHRRDGAADFYFTANRENRVQSVICHFRVTGRQPEWWNPVTGERRPLPDYTEKDGITTVPLRFAPFESAFIVFQKPAGKLPASGPNFPEFRVAMAVTGPWSVAFDPHWGGPGQTTFAALTDWSKSAQPGIRYYSGTATYRTKFHYLPQNPATSLCLDLGKVSVMARVRLNGRDLGIVWCNPWRVAVPAGLLRPGDNDLEITVANLWINRLIGDAGLPAEQRLTWTTWRPFTKDSPLQESGLLGPVTLQTTLATPPASPLP